LKSWAYGVDCRQNIDSVWVAGKILISKGIATRERSLSLAPDLIVKDSAEELSVLLMALGGLFCWGCVGFWVGEGLTAA
jgi:hypothetical protein